MSKEKKDHWEWFECVMDGVLKPEAIEEIVRNQDWQSAMYFMGTQLDIEMATCAFYRHQLKELKRVDAAGNS